MRLFISSAVNTARRFVRELPCLFLALGHVFRNFYARVFRGSGQDVFPSGPASVSAGPLKSG